nr:MAX gene-associated protein isoform X2 [Nothobranchius furzeri]
MVMSASDSKLAAMEDNHVVDEERDNLPVTPVTAPSTTAPPSSPSSLSFMSSLGPNFTGDSILESKAISMASNDCSYDISSPAEASPAKPAQTPPSIFVKTSDQSPDASRTISESDLQKCSEMSIINIQEAPSWSSSFPPTTFGNPEMGDHCPPTLTFKGVGVTLENNGIWMQFHQLGTEMILCKQGRRMFPYCRYRLSGLDPDRRYRLVLSIVPSDQFKYRWGTSKWEISGKSEHQSQGLIRAFSHHYGSCRGSDWMSSLVSFYKLKLSNNFQDQDGHVMLYSMHRYIPRLHVIPLPEEDSSSLNRCVVVGTESITFTFPQTEFMAVTTYQNFRITQLKINHNPFAKGFREDGNNPRLNRITSPVVKTDPQSEVFVPTEPCEINEETMDQSTTEQSASAPSPVEETKLVLKPIMSNCCGTGGQYVSCMRGKHALGELVLVEQPPEESSISGTPHTQRGLKKLPRSLVSTPRYRRKKRKVRKRWGMYPQPRVPRVWKAAASSPTVAPSPSLTVAMQPELDNIEGLLFVSFSTKEALEVHVRDMPASVSLFESPLPSPRPTESNETVEVNPETEVEKISQLESLLLTDLSSFRHGQIIHPVLHEVGMKLSSLDPEVPVDLKYLGVCLPPAPPSLLEQSSSSSLSFADEGLPFISRTGKTSDVTKIKGWRNKFTRSHETSPNCDRTQKNLSAFCSNMLDEYLESEAQRISERAEAFSTNPDASVAYQLPIRGSSYVKTLDSVLRNQNAALGTPAVANRPCPLSRKPRLDPSLTPSATPSSNPEPLSPAEAHSSSSLASPDAASRPGYSTEALQTLLMSHPAAVQKLVLKRGHKELMEKRLSNVSKIRLKLLEMEARAVNQGLSRTLLTPERLTMALTVLLTKETLAHQILQIPPMPKLEAGPECGEEFCRLGCVCSSLQLTDRGPIHCRKPECMFGCSCSETLTEMEQTVRPHQSSSAKKLWNRNVFDNDSEPLSIPTSAPFSPPPKALKRSQLHLAPPMCDEDKDPVYRYLERKLTCARVREFRSKSPPQLTLGSDVDAAVSKPDATPQSSAQNPPKQKDASVTTDQKAEEKPQQGKTFNETEAKKQIQINSLCEWKKDRRMVLDGLYKRLKQNRLHQQFCVGPYCISPVAKIVLQKPSGSIVTFRIQISKASKDSDCEEDEFDEYDDYVSDGNAEAEEDEPLEESGTLYGVAPFLRGVMPAGVLKAKRKPALFRGSGLIQVNGKHYSFARLLLGHMGSLHPANRVAAHVTGRLHLETDQKKQGGQNPINAGSLFFPVVPPFNEPVPVELRPQIVQILVPAQQNLRDNSVSSPVSLTVSQSLKCPSFLGQRGTYSFRICPPNNPASGGVNPVGVALPGGFTLIELPRPPADGAAQRVRPPNAPAVSNTGDALTQKREWASTLIPQSSKLALSSSSTTTSSSVPTSFLSFIPSSSITTTSSSATTSPSPSSTTSSSITTSSSSVPTSFLSFIPSSSITTTSSSATTSPSPSSTTSSSVPTSFLSFIPSSSITTTSSSATTSPSFTSSSSITTSSSSVPTSFLSFIPSSSITTTSSSATTSPSFTSSSSITTSSSATTFPSPSSITNTSSSITTSSSFAPTSSSITNTSSSITISSSFAPTSSSSATTFPSSSITNTPSSITTSSSSVPTSFSSFTPTSSIVTTSPSSSATTSPSSITNTTSSSSITTSSSSTTTTSPSPSITNTSSSITTSSSSFPTSVSFFTPTSSIVTTSSSSATTSPSSITNTTSSSSITTSSITNTTSSSSITTTSSSTTTTSPSPSITNTSSSSSITTSSSSTTTTSPSPSITNTSSAATTSSSSTTISSSTTTSSPTISSSSTTSSLSFELISEPKPQSAGTSSSNQTQKESIVDVTSEDLSSDLSDSEDMEDDEEPVDIETVEEKHSEIIAAMRRYALNQSQQTRDATSGPESSKDPDRLKKIKTWRKNHQELEKLRRGEERILFQKLQLTLECGPRTAKDRLLSTAVNEVATLQATSKKLDLIKEQLIQQQCAYVKKLSLMSGKSEAMIYSKLKEISERQKQLENKMKLKPIFSKLLQSKAALLQAAAPKSLHQKSSTYASPPPRTELSKAAQDNVRMLLHLLHPSKSLQKDSGVENSSRPQILLEQKVTPQTPKVNQPGETRPSDQTSQLPLMSDESQEVEDPEKTKEQPASDNQLVSGSSSNANAKALVPNPVASLPLIRSKTGRIILPSSLRPIGHGFYTLVMMEPQVQQEEDQVSSSDQDLSKNSDTSSDLTDLNPSNFRSPLEVQAMKNNQDPGVNTPTAPARLRFNPFQQPPPPTPPPPPGSLEPNPKSKLSPTRSSSAYLLGEEVEVEEFRMINSAVKLSQPSAESQRDEAGGVAHTPAPVKRGRGRPRKTLLSSPTKPAKRHSKSSPASVDSSIRFSISSLKSRNATEGDVCASKPLTRASLGKDFPSAKKRSWIDVEKELEPDLEYL